MTPPSNEKFNNSGNGHVHGVSSAFVKVNSPNVTYTSDTILSDYKYNSTIVSSSEDSYIVEPKVIHYQLKTQTRVPKTGVMIIGWGGNNGSTFTASLLANKLKLEWETKEGLKKSNFYGSLILASTTKLGATSSGKDIYIPMNRMLPMLDPSQLVIGGWDINNLNLAMAMKRAKVLDIDLQKQLKDKLEQLKPLPSIYYPDFIALNQSDRANNVLKGSKLENLEQIRKDIKQFKSDHDLEKVILLWSANTERFSEILSEVNDTEVNLLKSINEGHKEISPSTIFAVASILEGSPFINGSPQNTFVPGLLELASNQGVYIGGDDFKSGQTKLKSVLVDFLVNAGIKPLAITSYNHLGNNDGFNLKEQAMFRSKEISKSNVVDDMVRSNHILYPPSKKHNDSALMNGDNKEGHPDHTVVIKYVPTVGDSKRAIDEYVSEIFMGGLSTIMVYNVCEDSLLATPLMLDLLLLTEFMTRVTIKDDGEFQNFNSVLSLLSYMLKAPLVPKGHQVVNSLSRQRLAIENLLRACLALQPINELDLNYRL